MTSLAAAYTNVFHGGPLDGKTLTVAELLGAFHPIKGYKWTPELDQNGHRVWTFDPNGATVSITAPPKTPPAAPPATIPIRKKEDTMSATQTEPEVQTEETVPVDTEQTPVGTPLLDRRKALKVSRAKVAAEAGLTQAKIYRIENAGARTTPEESAVVSAALDRLEAAAGSTATAPEAGAEAEASDPS